MGNYQQPGISNPEDKIVWAESLGATLLFFPTQLQSQVKTAHGESDAVHAKVVRLNDGRVWENAMVFPTALVTQIKGAIPDGMVLGILGQGENSKGNPPWLLKPYTDVEVAMADAWMAANPRFAQPATPAQQAPAASQWGTPGNPTTAPQQQAWGQQPAAAPAPAAGGWGAPAPAQQQPAWSAPAAPQAQAAPAQQYAQQNAAQAGWGAPAAVPAQAPYQQEIQAPQPADPNLVAALQQRGINLPPGVDHVTALQAAAAVGLA